MTFEEAGAEAQKRWGPSAYVAVFRDVCRVHFGQLTGEAANWSDALYDMEVRIACSKPPRPVNGRR